MDNILYLWVYHNPASKTQPVLCGKLELLGGRKCIFTYDPAWIVNREAFALSVDLPLLPGQFEPPAGMQIHPVFEDAGPDRWGKNIIDKVLNPQRRSPLEYLELAGENRIGCLAFSRNESEYLPEESPVLQKTDLPALLHAIDALNLHLPLDDNMRRLLRPTSSAGGARPKAIIQHNGRESIAKFPDEGDAYDVCTIEHASLKLARYCGINAVDTELLPVGKQQVLLVTRFDRNPDRNHFVSARTMLIAEGLQENRMGYADLADSIRKFSASPKDTCHEIYRRMVFNILIENTDDHERNHGFLLKGGEWHLSPAYDVLPQHLGLGYHHLIIGKLDGHMGTLANALSDCKRFLLQPGEAEQVIKEIHGNVLGWKLHFKQAGVIQRDIETFTKYILRDPIYYFGRVPAKFEVPKNRDYVGLVNVVDKDHVYLGHGRNQSLQINRKELIERLPEGMLIFPSTELELKFRDSQMTVIGCKSTPRPREFPRFSHGEESGNLIVV